MTKQKWYSPQLSRDIVRRLYFEAKAEGIPMTRLANKIMQQALGEELPVECPRDDRHQQDRLRPKS